MGEGGGAYYVNCNKTVLLSSKPRAANQKESAVNDDDGGLGHLSLPVAPLASQLAADGTIIYCGAPH